MIRILATLKAGLAVLLMAGPAAAQTTGEADSVLPEPATREAINEMVARMSDDEVRAFLIERLDAVSEGAAGSEPAGMVQQLDNWWTAFSTPISEAVSKLPVLVARQGDAFVTFAERLGGASGVLELVGLSLLVLAIGFAGEFLARRYIVVPAPVRPDPGQDSLMLSLKFLSRRLISQMLGLVVFYILIRSFGRILLSPEQLAVAAPFVLYLIWQPRLIAALCRFVLAPKMSEQRLVSVDDSTARFLYRGLVGLIVWIGFTIFIVNFSFRNGIAPGETRLAFWLDSAVYLFLGYIIWRARDGLADMVRGDAEKDGYEARAARWYVWYALLVVAGTWVLVNTLVGLGQVENLLRGAHYVTMSCLLLGPLADTAVRGLVRHLLPPMTGEGATAEAAHDATERSYVRIGRVAVIGALVILIAQTWGMKPVELLTEAAGIGDNLFRFLMTLVVGYFVLEGTSLWINQKLRAEKSAQTPTDDEAEMGGAGATRLSTVLPLALVTARTAIVVIFGLLAIGNLGIDITPLLAGAGIAGLAIGFGAQKLVTDVVSGVFFLVDDAFRIGEYVEIDGTMGTVEKISIRSMTLRHHRGPLHTIPYGEIPKLTNYSRDWVIMKLMFTVNFDTDPNKVKKIFKKIGAELMQDPLFKDDFLEPFKSQGVLTFDDVGMVIRGKFMAKPGKQFTIRKELLSRVQAEFAANGIQFARREVRVALPEGKDPASLTHAERDAIAAAATAAAQPEAKA